MATHLKYNFGWLTHNNTADNDKVINHKTAKTKKHQYLWDTPKPHPYIFILFQHLDEIPDLDGFPKC